MNRVVGKRIPNFDKLVGEDSSWKFILFVSDSDAVNFKVFKLAVASYQRYRRFSPLKFQSIIYLLFLLRGERAISVY